MIVNNRPTYAPERRPGDPLHDVAGYELVVLHLALPDVMTIASLVEAGSAALKYAPARATNVTELSFRQRDYRLGSSVAKALRSEGARVHDRNEHRHRQAAKKKR